MSIKICAVKRAPKSLEKEGTNAFCHEIIGNATPIKAASALGMVSAVPLTRRTIEHRSGHAAGPVGPPRASQYADYQKE